jgi:hypothetical protein
VALISLSLLLVVVWAWFGKHENEVEREVKAWGGVVRWSKLFFAHAPTSLLADRFQTMASDHLVA